MNSPTFLQGSVFSAVLRTHCNPASMLPAWSCAQHVDGRGGEVDIEDPVSVPSACLCWPSLWASWLGVCTARHLLSVLSLSLQARTWLALWALREFAYDLGYGVPWASVMHGSPSLLLIHPPPVWRQLIIWVSSHSLPLGHLGLDARGTAV